MKLETQVYMNTWLGSCQQTVNFFWVQNNYQNKSASTKMSTKEEFKEIIHALISSIGASCSEYELRRLYWNEAGETVEKSMQKVKIIKKEKFQKVHKLSSSGIADSSFLPGISQARVL